MEIEGFEDDLNYALKFLKKIVKDQKIRNFLKMFCLKSRK